MSGRFLRKIVTNPINKERFSIKRSTDATNINSQVMQICLCSSLFTYEALNICREYAIKTRLLIGGTGMMNSLVHHFADVLNAQFNVTRCS
ncbi:hypothetical protein EVAR_91308_1 [Eumeta japonica]|uniref:Uncharacterized protein n=1 Tax=Eumeta variegata TaxID=151549 RepID=A0A4C1SPC0_EUMVA|nr:hypothetical protein EVAR_91308_1 [Eumeta japonica]